MGDTKMKSKTPFRDLVNKLHQIKKEPLTKEKISKINTILEKTKQDEEKIGSYEIDKRKIALPSDSVQNGITIQ